MVAGALDGLYVQRLRNDVPDLTARRQVRLVLPAQDDLMLQRLDSVLSEVLEGDSAYRFSMIRTGLASCQAYISHSGILIRPLVPPTHENSIFRDARQRVYLSATLGQCGELERAFGRRRIARLPLPTPNTPNLSLIHISEPTRPY